MSANSENCSPESMMSNVLLDQAEIPLMVMQITKKQQIHTQRRNSSQTPIDRKFFMDPQCNPPCRILLIKLVSGP